MNQITININNIDFLQRGSLQEKETSESTALNQACPEGFFFFFGSSEGCTQIKIN